MSWHTLNIEANKYRKNCETFIKNYSLQNTLIVLDLLIKYLKYHRINYFHVSLFQNIEK